jgi:Fic family protein
LRGVAETANEAAETAGRIFEMREQHRAMAMEKAGTNGLRLLSALLQRPLVNVNYVADHVDVTFPTANRLVSTFMELGLLREQTGQRRSRLFRYEPYVRLFDDSDEPTELGAVDEAESTISA